MEGVNMVATDPWVMSVEALLHMKQVDISGILGLIKGGPEISDDLGRNIIELLSIRILEELYAREVRNKNSSVPPPGSQINIDPSYSCEDVVSGILELASPLNPRFNVAHILELDVPSFISRKRSGIQSSFLHQMKNEILEGSNTILKELKDRSGLEVPVEDSGITIDVGVSNGIADKHGVSGNTKPKRKLASLTAEDDEILEKNLPVQNENLSLPKGERNSSVAKNCEVASPKSKKRLKFPASFSQHEQLGNSSSRTVDQVDELLDRETEPEIQSIEESRGKEDRCVDASARLKENNDVDHSVDSQCQQQVPDVNLTPEIFSRENDGHVNCSDKVIGSNECAFEPPPVAENVSRDNVEENRSIEANDTVSPKFQNNVDHTMCQDNNVHGDNLEISSDSDKHHDVLNDIATMKNSFLRSQRMDTQDSVATLLNSCVKCNKDGNLLICSSSWCHLVVHQECLGVVTDFDRMGNFKCPFCAYSQVISRYQEAKKKFSLRIADLTALFRPELAENNSTKRFHGSKKHGSREIQNNHDSLNVLVGEPSKSGPRVEAFCGENEKSLSRDPKIISPNEIHNQMIEKEEVLNQSDSESTCAPQCSDLNAEKNSDAESEKNDTSKYCIRPRKQGRQIMEPTQLRRKKLPWTNVEEQTLKEGVRRFSSYDDKTIPWKKIWEFGAEVFKKRRNHIDLKDKWRNICKGSPKKEMI